MQSRIMVKQTIAALDESVASEAQTECLALLAVTPDGIVGLQGTPRRLSASSHGVVKRREQRGTVGPKGKRRAPVMLSQ